MDINTGNLITFVLTIFSTLTAIIPFAVQSEAPDNQFFQINTERATALILDHNSPLESKLWAFNQLREYYNMNQTYSDIQKDIHKDNETQVVVDSNFKNITNDIANILNNNGSTFRNVASNISYNINNLQKNLENATVTTTGHLINDLLRNIIRDEKDILYNLTVWHIIDKINNNITTSYGRIKSAHIRTQSLMNLQKNNFEKDSIEMTIMAYNTNSSEKYLKNLKVVPNEILWYPLRMADLEATHVPYEDRSCRHTLCSFEELNKIGTALKDLKENGNTSDYYNDVNKIHSLQKPLDTFLSDMNYFIIVSFVTGPIVFFAGAKFFSK